MSLTNRLSLYFVAAIGVVLIGFSLVIFYIVRGHLSAQLDHRLDAMTHALVSAIEIHPGDVEWEPLERKIKIGEDPSLEQPRWAVRNLAGTLIDCLRCFRFRGQSSFLNRHDCYWVSNSAGVR